MKKLFALVIVLSFLVIIPRAWAGAPPPNDACGNAIGPLSVPSTTSGTTIDATGDEPPAFQCGGSAGVGDHGVWYTVTGTGNTMTASTCDFADFDTQISVFCPNCDNPVCIGGNDDFCSLQSSVSWPSEAGATYRILVHGFGSATGNFDLAILDDGTPVDPATVVDCEEVLFGTFCSTDVPVNFPPAGSSDLIIGFGPTITDVKVRLFITHTFDGDVEVDLDSPDGSNSFLINNVGGSNNNFGTSCGDQIATFPNFVLMDGAPPIPSNPGVAGTFSPTPGNLATFNGESSIGTWTLNLDDDFPSEDDGTLECWCLDIFSTGEGCSPGFWPRQGRVDSSLFLGCPDPNLDPTDLVQTCFACNLDNDLPDSIELASCQNIMKNANLANTKGDKKFGAAAKLLRQGMAGILNACNPCVDYPLTVTEVRDKVCDLLDELDDVTLQEINDCKNELDANNSQSCEACEGDG